MIDGCAGFAINLTKEGGFGYKISNREKWEKLVTM
jgi:hypothetical protein